MALLLIPVLAALAFTVAAFWWMYLRPGHLTVAPPSSYSTPPGAVLHLRFPLVFVNEGALPQVVCDLRLQVAGDHEFHWTSIRSKVSPAMDDFVDAAAPFVVKGRDARQMFLEFGQVPPEWRPQAGQAYPVKLEARDDAGEWTPLLEFHWFVPERADLLASGVAHRNLPTSGPLV